MARCVRKIRVEGDVAYVPLTQGYEAVIDAADVPLVGGVNWTANVRPQGCYAYRHKPRPDSGPIYLHRFLMGDPDELDVDHVDGDRLNNRRSNLRLATRSQNMQNGKLRKDNTSGHKGVVFIKETGKWRAQVARDGRAMYFGNYATIEEAIDAARAARESLHGAFAREK
jgi:HNH endonuclease/AP2 domain